MIIIGPGFALLIFLCMFKPIRMIVGWILFAALCFVIYACATMPN